MSQSEKKVISSSLVTKLAKVMQEVKYIEKRGYNKFHKYKYATESDVSEKVREILAEQNVIMLPDVIEHTTRNHTNGKGNIEYISTVKIKFNFIDGDTGEELSIHSVGEGQDAGDKAVYKAITGATKYALMKAFMIPTGDDPEADQKTDESNDQQAPQTEVGRPVLLAKFKQNGGTEEHFNEWYAKQTSAGFSNTQIDQFLTKKLMEKSNDQAST